MAAQEQHPNKAMIPATSSSTGAAALVIGLDELTTKPLVARG